MVPGRVALSLTACEKTTTHFTRDSPPVSCIGQNHDLERCTRVEGRLPPDAFVPVQCQPEEHALRHVRVGCDCCAQERVWMLDVLQHSLDRGTWVSEQSGDPQSGAMR